MHLSKPQLAALFVAMLLVGVLGAMSYTLYHRHSTQHWHAEEFERNQKLFNDEIVKAINSLAQRK